MKTKLLSLLVAAIFILGASCDIYARSTRTSDTDVFVNGYTKSNGTYVEPHYRSAPDGIKSNNYSCIDYGNCGSVSTGNSGYVPSFKYVPLADNIVCGKNTYKENRSCYCKSGYIPGYNSVDCVLKNTQKTCDRKYPGTIYVENSDMCLCESGNRYNQRTRSCDEENYKCNIKYPGTVYRKSDNKCYCSNQEEWDSDNYCDKSSSQVETNATTSHIVKNTSGICKANEYYSDTSDACYCNPGYSTYKGACTNDKDIEKLLCKANEYYSDTSDACYCNPGYSEKNNSGKCTKD